MLEVNDLKFRKLIHHSLDLLDSRTRKKLILISVLQAGLSLLDLLAVAAVGLVTALGVSSAQLVAPGSRVGSILTLLRIDSSSPQTQALILSAGALSLMVLRTVLSIFFMRKEKKLNLNLSFYRS